MHHAAAAHSSMNEIGGWLVASCSSAEPTRMKSAGGVCDCCACAEFPPAPKNPCYRGFAGAVVEGTGPNRSDWRVARNKGRHQHEGEEEEEEDRRAARSGN